MVWFGRRAACHTHTHPRMDNHSLTHSLEQTRRGRLPAVRAGSASAVQQVPQVVTRTRPSAGPAARRHPSARRGLAAAVIKQPRRRHPVHIHLPSPQVCSSAACNHHPCDPRVPDKQGSRQVHVCSRAGTQHLLCMTSAVVPHGRAHFAAPVACIGRAAVSRGPQCMPTRCSSLSLSPLISPSQCWVPPLDQAVVAGLQRLVVPRGRLQNDNPQQGETPPRLRPSFAVTIAAGRSGEDPQPPAARGQGLAGGDPS